jgi:hypothetical protein
MSEMFNFFRGLIDNSNKSSAVDVIEKTCRIHMIVTSGIKNNCFIDIMYYNNANNSISFTINEFDGKEVPLNNYNGRDKTFDINLDKFDLLAEEGGRTSYNIDSLFKVNDIPIIEYIFNQIPEEVKDRDRCINSIKSYQEREDWEEE